MSTPYPFGGDDLSAGAYDGPQYARLLNVHTEIMSWPGSQNGPFRYNDFDIVLSLLSALAPASTVTALPGRIVYIMLLNTEC